MSIADNSVGIGTIKTSGYKLAVKGYIHAQGVTLDMNNWPDYVFKKSYKLMPLTEYPKMNYLKGWEKLSLKDMNHFQIQKFCSST